MDAEKQGAGCGQGFGRDANADGEPTDIGCPDCRGVLRLQAESRPGLRVLRCLIGHTFSNESLLEAKEDQAEEAMWTAAEVFQELCLIHQALAEDARGRGDDDAARRCQQRAERAADNAAALRRLIQADRPVAFGEERGGP